MWFGARAGGSSEADARAVWDVLTRMAAALSQANLIAFLGAFDRSMAVYATLEANVSALLDQYEVQSSIELLEEGASGGVRTIDLDWFLQLEEQRDAGTVTRRRERVHCRLEKRGKNWKITAIEPVAFFAPPETGTEQRTRRNPA